jgi:hypothetical protein
MFENGKSVFRGDSILLKKSPKVYMLAFAAMECLAEELYPKTFLAGQLPTV